MSISEKSGQSDEKLVRFWVSKYSWLTQIRADIDGEDLSQSVRLGLFRAKKSFDPGLGTWANYSAHFVKTEVMTLVGRPEPKLMRLDAPVIDGEEETLLDTIEDESLPDADQRLLDSERKQTIRDAVGRLPDQQRDVVELRYYSVLSKKKTAEALNLDMLQVRKVFEKAVRQLRRDQRLRELRQTVCHLHVGVTSFQRTRTSAVELAFLIMERENQRMKAIAEESEASL